MILAIIFFAVGCTMLQKLKKFYKGFYKQFRCNLWTANILMTVPLTFRAIFDGLTFNKDFFNYWFGDANYYRIAVYNTLIFVIATLIPMLMQIFSLIFGFVRTKQVKLFTQYNKFDDS